MTTWAAATDEMGHEKLLCPNGACSFAQLAADYDRGAPVFNKDNSEMAAVTVGVLALMGLGQCPKELAQEMFVVHGRRPVEDFDDIWREYQSNCTEKHGDDWDVRHWGLH